MDSTDDRIRCSPDCARYVGKSGECGAATEMGLKRYGPVADLPRRCVHFRPHPDATDQRTGREKWPTLEIWEREHMAEVRRRAGIKGVPVLPARARLEDLPHAPSTPSPVDLW